MTQDLGSATPVERATPPRSKLTLESHFGEWEEGVYVTVSNGPSDSAIYRVARRLGHGSWQLEHVPEAEGRITVRAEHSPSAERTP